MILRFLTRYTKHALFTFVPALAMLASNAYAVGLGELEHNTYLGQKLDARIQILAADDYGPENIRLRRIGPTEAESRGFDITFSPYTYDVEPIVEAGRVTSVAVQSNENIFEPYIDILIELAWPTGSVLREYAVLFDAPPTKIVSQPATESIQAQAFDRSAENVAIELGARYQVNPGDSLSGILARVALPSGVSRNDLMQSVFRQNPQAFQSDNINFLKAGAILNLPSNPSALPAPRRANLSGQTLNPGSNAANTAVTNNAKGRDGRLTLSQPDETSVASEYTAPKMQERIDGTQEMIDLLMKENQELRERIENIESSEYLNTLNELVAVQQKQIAQLTESYANQNSTAASNSVELSAPLLTNGEESLGEEPKTLSTLLAENFALFFGTVLLGIVALVALAGFVIYQFGPRRSAIEAKNAYTEATATASEAEIEDKIDSGLQLAEPSEPVSETDVPTTSAHESEADASTSESPSANVTSIGFAVENRRDLQSLRAASPEKEELDAEVKDRIRKKTEEYNSAELSSSAPSRINDVEIDVLVGMDDEVNELLSMAKIYCSAGKYSEARTILSAQNDIMKDPRLRDALKQIEEMESTS